MKLKLQMLTGKHSILCSTGREIFYFDFNKQYMNKRTISLGIRKGKKNPTVLSEEIQTRDMAAKASTKQAPSALL